MTVVLLNIVLMMVLAGTDGGAAIIDNGYTGTIDSGFGNPLAGRAAFVNDSMGNYTSSRLDLSALAGQDVKVRFRIGTDESVSNPGWDIDNVRVYTCDVELTEPAIISPVSGSTLSGITEVFNWSNNGLNVSQWYMYAGSTEGGAEYYVQGGTGGTTTATMTNLPTDESTVYIRLWSVIDGSYVKADAVYTASTAVITPSITSPVSGSTLSGITEVFNWSNNGLNVSQWYMYAGSTEGGAEYYVQGGTGGTTTATMTNLPTDESTVYIRLWSVIDGSFVKADAVYTASTAVITPSITSPVSGSTLSGITEVFNWSNNGLNVSQWYMYAGSTEGGAEYYVQGGTGGTTTATMTNLPTDESTVYIRLWSVIDGSYVKADAVYTASTAVITPSITSPVSGSTLSGITEVFNWSNNGLNVSQW